MELISINKKSKNQAEILLEFADVTKNYSFLYFDNDIFAVDFPEDLRKILRLLPVSVTHSLVAKIENFLTSNINDLPFEVEIEKEILQMV
jgi:hypothetical protein